MNPATGRPKRYLVTGGTGFIGSSLVRRLVKEGHQVRVLDDFSRGADRRLEDIAKKIEIIRGDIRDTAVVSQAAQGVDSVCHLAFINGTEFFYSKPDLVLEVGVKGMMNVLDACQIHQVSELILASSSEVYQSPPVVPTDETAPLTVPDPMNPRYSYAAGKIISEMLAINYGRKRIPRVVIFRPHNVYGPDMGWEHVLPEFALRMKEAVKKYPTGAAEFGILGTGKETRSFIFIDDFTDGLRLVMEKGEHLGIYHIGTREEISIQEAAEAVGRCFGRSLTVVSAKNAPLGGTVRRCPDIKKIEALGFRAKVNFENGLRSTVEWYDQNSHLAPIKNVQEKK